MSRQRSWVCMPLLAGLIGCAPGAPPAAGGAGRPAGRPAAASAAGSDAGAAAARSGASLFNGNCSACHQANGEGIAGVYPSLSGSPTVLGDPQALSLWVVGGQRAATMTTEHYATAMPQFEWLEPEEAAALLTYIRSSFGNHASPVDAATVAAALGRAMR